MKMKYIGKPLFIDSKDANLGLQNMPRKSHNREFVHQFMVDEQENTRYNKHCLNSHAADGAIWI